METLASLREQLPEAAKDIKLNLQSVLSGGPLTAAQRWGVVVATALTARQPELSRVLVQEARQEAGDAVVEDAVAAAALMGMNNVFYRFRHRIGKEEYGEKPARLRMNRLVKPATNRPDFELFSLAVSAINDCETCVRAHEQAVIEAGISADAVLDAVRIAATVYGAAVALEAGAALRASPAAAQVALAQPPV